MNKNNLFAKVAVWIVIALVLFTVFKQFDGAKKMVSNEPSTSYTQFMDQAKEGKIKRVDVQGRTLTVTPTEGATYKITAPGDLWMVEDLRKAGVQVYGQPDEEQSFLASIFISWFPMLILIGVWIFFMRQMQGGGKGGAFSFGKSKARMLDSSNNNVTFADVAGCDEAKEEVTEIVDYLKDPSRYQRLGGRIPRGVLLVGSPGTGKTLLAKAIAGEAKVPFFTISGSDFVEMFVGVGAARVRDMFENAKKNSPCIIFIDEIDAVGRQRGAGLGGGSSDAATTLIGLNRLWDLGVSREELAAWGTELGADVPFFIQGENAFVEGIGERITPIPVPAHDFLIVYPGAFSATDRAFRDFDLTTPPLSPKISGLSCLYQDKAFHFGFGHNDLQPVVTQSTPAVRQAIQMLSPFGSVRMTGAGSAVFLPLQSGSDAIRVLENLPEGWSGYAVNSLERHPLSDWVRSGTGS